MTIIMVKSKINEVLIFNFKSGHYNDQSEY
jgi:hypothetical protein